MRLRAAAALLVLGLALCVHAAAAPLGDVTLRRSDGQVVRLGELAGKPAVLFYEDRGSIATNQAVKDALIARGRRDRLLDAASVIAIANIAAYDFTPAREIATAFIRRAERRAGIPILIDVEGVLLRPPWSLPDDDSTVLLLDSRGEIVWRHSGRLSAADTDRMLDRLHEMATAS